MIEKISGQEFANRFALRPQTYAWLLGAGASASAGIPTGYAMIVDFKKRLFCRHANIPIKDVDANDPMWLARIDEFLRARSILPNSENEYAAAFEAVYPSQEDRRAYIEGAIRKGSPSFCHRVLASLISTQKIPCIFTTNFDPLVEAAATVTDQLLEPKQRAHLTTAAIDSVARADLCMSESRWPLLAKIHGDYQSVDLKNTTAELKTQDAQMRAVMSTACARFGLIVVGYSGRDESVMAALADVLKKSEAFPTGLFWVSRPGSPLLPAVQGFLEAADSAGVRVSIVESQTFDELAADVVDCFDLPAPLSSHVYEDRPMPVLRDVPLPTNEQRKFPVLQCSALPIRSLPTVARRIKLSAQITTTRAREIVKEAKIKGIVASLGSELAVFGNDVELERAFAIVGGRLSGTINLQPDVDSWARGLLYDALVQALCRKRPLSSKLRRKGHSLIVRRDAPGEKPELVAQRERELAGLKAAYSSSLVGTVPELGYPFGEGVQIRLDHLDQRWWCAFEPFTYVEFPRVELLADLDGSEKLDDQSLQEFSVGNPAVDWRRERWANRYNRVWAKIIAAWAALLAGDGSRGLRALEVEPNAGVDAEFRLSSFTAWSRPSHEHDYFLRVGR